MRFISNFGLLGTMISGVLWKRDPTHLWNILYFQGLFWISAAILTEVPDVVCRFSISFLTLPSSPDCVILLHYPGDAFHRHQW
jgi:hypothetical protein